MDKYLSNTDPQAIESLYQSWKADSNSVDLQWQKFFLGFEFALANYKDSGMDISDSEFKVIKLIEGYRLRGHLFTKTNPVRNRRKHTPTLDIENFGLTTADLQKTFQAGKIIGIGATTLEKIIEHLNNTYCRSIGVEYMYLRDPKYVEWIQSRIEKSANKTEFTFEQRKHIFHHLILAVGFEQFIHRKFIGQKRFSLEGIEALIPALDTTIEHGSEFGAEEFVIGMAHRGR
ncbi:MAG TPA: 2-oxoglutarate dehydrogenase E1 component, partial [Tenuifilaceae bacterium]|nr:2-oxoglutarate dehydrogenase E1 component [Tenuifilaceae bacterium]